MSRAIVKGKEEENSILFRIRENDKVVFKRIPFNNYFFILFEDWETVEFLIRNYVKETEIFEDKFGVSYVKIILNNNHRRYYCKKTIENTGVTTFESDIDSVKRFLIENQNVPLNQQGLKVCFFDIETDDRLPLSHDFKRVVEAKGPILSYAIKDKSGKIIFKLNKAREKENFTEQDFLDGEKELLLSMLEDLKDYDIVHAYNGWSFDFAYIKQRSSLYNIDFDDLMQQHIDYMIVYKKYIYATFKSFSLNAVSYREFKHLIDEGDAKAEEVTKIDWREKTGLKKFYELWKYEPKLLEEYNIQDVNLMLMLEEKLKFDDLGFVLADISHCFYSETIFNSHSFDYAMLNRYYQRKMISPSKPDNEEKERRQDIKIGGGYTYCYDRGLHKQLAAFDYKSFYPTTSITFNISPDTFVHDSYPTKEKLLEIFSEEEFDFIKEVIGMNKAYLNKKGDFNAGKYDKDIAKLTKDRLYNFTMEELMWRFIKEYDVSYLEEYAKEKDYVFTPADLNHDTNGWNFHPHRFYRREEGVFPEICKTSIITRDKLKYKLKIIEKEKGKDNDEWEETNLHQGGFKLLGNSGYGTFGFRSFRYFTYNVSDAITTSCRFIMKKSILFARKQGFVITNGDTDSSYMRNEENKYTFKEMDKVFYDYYDELVKPFNTNAVIEHRNPETKEIEVKNHFIVFEHEKTLESCIVVAKKRYYYKSILQNGEVEYSTQGGAYKKSDTMPLAAEIQKELTTDILDFNYDSDVWLEKIKELKKLVYEDKLDVFQMIMIKAISKDLEDYGNPVIDGNTGMQKVRKSDGAPMFSPIPAHIQIAKYFVEIQKELAVGDKIEYVIYDKTGKIIPLDIETYNKCKELKEAGKDFSQIIKNISYIMREYNKFDDKRKQQFEFNRLYDRDYYWERIESVLLEILVIVDPENVYTKYKECWNFSKSQIEKLVEELEGEEL